MLGNVDFGRSSGGGKKSDKLILAAVAVAAAGAVGLLIAAVLSDDKVEETPWVVRFQCLDVTCGHEWEPGAAQLKADPEMLLSPRVRCPRCKGMTGVQMTQCPRCKRFFVSARRLNPDAPFTPEMMKNVCPHCNTDIMQWQKEQREKKGR